MDNFVDKHPLTGAEARFYAGFNKVLKRIAIIYLFKIKDLKNSFNHKKNNLRKISFAFPLAFFVHKMSFDASNNKKIFYFVSTI